MIENMQRLYKHGLLSHVSNTLHTWNSHLGAVYIMHFIYEAGLNTDPCIKPLESSTYICKESKQTYIHTKSREILMFVCLQKDAKQCCDATKRGCTHCAGRRPQAGDQHNEYNLALWHHHIVWHLFGDKQTSKSHET